MVSNCPLISKSSSPFTNSLGIVLSSPITIFITITIIFHCLLVLWQSLGTYFSFWFLLFLLCGPLRQQRPLFSRFSFFCWSSLGLVDWPRLDDLFISQNPRKVYEFHAPEEILSCFYTTCSYSQIKIFCTIPSGLSSPLSHV